MGIHSKEPHYVRCIKPNGAKSPVLFDQKLVEHQVAYLGLLENVRVRRAGFAYRQEYWRFLRRYKMISQFTWPNFHGGDAEEGTRSSFSSVNTLFVNLVTSPFVVLSNILMNMLIKLNG